MKRYGSAVDSSWTAILKPKLECSVCRKFLEIGAKSFNRLHVKALE